MSAKRKRDGGKTSEVLKTLEVSKTAEVSPSDIQPAPYELPDGWTWTTLESVLESHRGGVWGDQAEEGNGYPVLRSTNMRGGKLDFTEVARCKISEDVAKQAALISGDIIVSKSSGSPHLVGLPALFESSPDGQTYLYSNFTMRLRPDGKRILPKFLFHFLAREKAEADRRGMAQDTTGLRNLKVREYLAQPISLAPLPDQRRIVAKIEQLFAESRTARDALERVPALLKRFRQSVLAAAFRGQLSERDPNDEPASALLERIRAERRAKWEKDLHAKGKDPSKAKYEEPGPPDTSYLRELPEGWIWTTTTQVCGSVADGTHDTPKYVEHGIPLVTSKNLKEDGLDFANIRNISVDDHDRIKVRSGIEKGDILFAMIGTVGNPVIVQTEKPFSAKNVGLFRKNESFIKSEFLRFWFMGWDFNKILEEHFLKGTTQKFVPLEGLRTFPVPLAPLAEQRRIVARIEALFAQADAIERAVAIARQRADKIDQSILSRAFRGEL